MATEIGGVIVTETEFDCDGSVIETAVSVTIAELGILAGAI
jgi:hypothetical protein